MEEKRYNCYFESQEGESLELETLRYMIKNYYFIELELENGRQIRQRKDINCTIQDVNGDTIDIAYGDLYLTDGKNLLEVRGGRGSEELEKWIEDCEIKK